MDGKAGWFVERKQKFVFEQHRLFERFAARRRRLRGPCCDTHGRQAQFVAGLDAVIRFRAAAVDPHLAAAQDPVDMALRHALEYLDQVIVDALAAGVLRHRVAGNGIFAQTRHFAYTYRWLADFRTDVPSHALNRGIPQVTRGRLARRHVVAVQVRKVAVRNRSRYCE